MQAVDITVVIVPKYREHPPYSVCIAAGMPSQVKWRGGCWLDGTQQETEEKTVNRLFGVIRCRGQEQ